MSRRRIGLLATALLGALAVPPVVARDGMVPVFAPVVIGASGKYHLTRNITAPGPVITIGPGAIDVDLDLNGFTIVETSGAAPVISVPGTGPDHLVVHNGTLAGGTAGIDVFTAFAAPLRQVVIERVKIRDTDGPGIHLGEVSSAVIRDSEIHDAAAEGILWDGNVFAKNGTIEDNLIASCAQGIFIAFCTSIAIVSNRIEDIVALGPPFGEGIELESCFLGALVAENTIRGTTADGILLANSRHAKLFDNIVTGAGCNGIHIDAAARGVLVWRNVVSSNGFAPAGCPVAQPAGDGIMVEGDGNYLDGNLTVSNSRMGIHLTGPTSVPANAGGACNNAFTMNSTVGNTGGGPCVGAPAAPVPPDFCNNIAVGLCAGGPGNTSGGQNVKAGSAVY